MISKAIFISPSGLEGEERNVVIERYVCNKRVYPIEASNMRLESDNRFISLELSKSVRCNFITWDVILSGDSNGLSESAPLGVKYTSRKGNL